MDTLYTVNSGSRDLRWGASTDAALGNVLALGFNCYRIAVMRDQKYLYVTGHKNVRQVWGFEPHAWLVVVDTCTNTVTQQLDLGIGFAGQCAVPPVAGLNRAYIAISQALGNTDAGAHGPNRIAVVDLTRPEAPSRPPAGQLAEIGIPSTNPYGPLAVVWSSILDRLYTCHRSDGTVFSVDPQGGNVQQLMALTEQPMALGVAEIQGIPRLFVGRRLAGDLVEMALSPQMPRPPQPLQNAATCSGMFIAINPLDPLERVLVTATRPDPPCTHPADGILHIFQRPASGIPQVHTVDIQGSRLGQPAVHPDGSQVYIPRGDQNDIAVVDLNNNTLSPAFIGTGSVPSDIAVVSHDASARPEATPQQLSVECMVPTDVTIRVYDACDQEIAGKRISATGTANVIVSPQFPQDLPSPATFSVECTQGGPGSVLFAMRDFPHSSVTLGVQCVCPSPYCDGFGPPGPVPAALNIGPVALALSVIAGSPSVTPRGLWLNRGTVRFQVPASAVVENLTITLERMDTNLPEDRVVITHSTGTAVVLSPGGLARGVWVIPGLFQGITEWRITGGPESYVREICLFA